MKKELHQISSQLAEVCSIHASDMEEESEEERAVIRQKSKRELKEEQRHSGRSSRAALPRIESRAEMRTKSLIKSQMQLESLKTELQKTHSASDKQIKYLLIQKEVLEKDVEDLLKKNEAIENYVKALIERNNEEYGLLEGARLELQNQTAEFLAS